MFVEVQLTKGPVRPQPSALIPFKCQAFVVVTLRQGKLFLCFVHLLSHHSCVYVTPGSSFIWPAYAVMGKQLGSGTCSPKVTGLRGKIPSTASVAWTRTTLGKSEITNGLTFIKGQRSYVYLTEPRKIRDEKICNICRNVKVYSLL